MSGPTTTTIRSNVGRQLSIKCASIARPHSRCAAFGIAERIRVPSPAASSTAVAPMHAGVAKDGPPCQRTGQHFGLHNVTSARPVLLLDLDGTLVDSVPDLCASLNRVLAPDPPFTRSEVVPMIGDGAAKLVQRALSRRGIQDADALPRLLDDYTAHAGDRTRLFPGVGDTLAGLAGDWRLAICTNKPASATHALLAALGIGGLFAAIGAGDSFPVRKPDPDHLRLTLDRAGGGKAVMVGDHANDVQAAAGAGVPCIFAAWGYGSPPMAEGAAGIADRFEDVPALARRLLQGG